MTNTVYSKNNIFRLFKKLFSKSNATGLSINRHSGYYFHYFIKFHVQMKQLTKPTLFYLSAFHKILHNEQAKIIFTRTLPLPKALVLYT